MNWQQIKQHPWLSNGLLLAAFALATTLLIGLTYSGTQGAIAEQERKQLFQQLNQVLPATLYDNDPSLDCALLDDGGRPVYRARKAGKNQAVAVRILAPDGYNGAIFLLVGIAADGTILGVRTVSHKETPGLGDKIDLRISDWVLDFNGKRLSEKNQNSWAVHKDGGQFDQFTGATITPRAVVKAVKAVLQEFASNQQQWFELHANCPQEPTT